MVAKKLSKEMVLLLRIDNQSIFSVESIVGKRTINNEVKYNVKWVGYPSSQNTWEPISHLEDCEDLIEDFEKRRRPGRPPKTKSIRSLSTPV